MIKHIYFDWSGTLAHSGSKTILENGTLSQKKATLYPDTLFILQYLYKKGYSIGIISNTKKDIPLLQKGLNEIGVDKFLNGAIVFSNNKDIKTKKPYEEIFIKAMEKDGAKPETSLMIGNDYEKDIIGAKEVGMNTVFVDRQQPCMLGDEKFHIHNLRELIYYL